MELVLSMTLRNITYGALAIIALDVPAIAAMYNVLAPVSASAQTACPTAIMKVCAFNKNGNRADYNNACEARRVGATILHEGKCLGPICEREWKPVCAINPLSHMPQTYASACFADLANAVFLRNGTCK